MKDSILWDKESDNYTQRAKENFGNVYEHYDLFAVNKCAELVNFFGVDVKQILDLGCAYGGFLFHLSKKFQNASFHGIDPGEESIAFATQNISGPNKSFRNGHSHELPFADGQFDLVVINMVLQWVPRHYLLKTLAEIDRVLAKDGVIFIQEFLPHIPKYSTSAHSAEVLIFKDDYESFFTAFPWYKTLHKEVLDSQKGDDHQKVVFMLKKIDLEQAYSLKVW